MIDTQLQKKLPFSFWMEDVHEHSTIYIVDETLREQQRLSLLLENTLGAPLYFAPIDLEAGPPTAVNCHFELRFRRGVLAHASLGTSNNKLLTGKSIGLLLSGKYEKKVYETGSWVISQPEDVTGRPYLSFYLARAGKESAGLFDVGQQLKMVLTNISASPEFGARESRVELVPRQVFYLPNLAEEARVRQPREQTLQVVNHLGKEHIPLHAAFVGPNTVLNDGEDHGAGYSLKLRLTNISKHEPIIFKKDSRIIFEFDFSDGDVEEALGEAGNEDKIVFKFDGQTINLSPGDEISRNPHWRLDHVNHLAEKRLDPHTHWDFEIDLANFSTLSPAGLTLLKIKYENVPGYWDGELYGVVEKTPMLVKQEGNSVKLDTGVRPAYFTGNLGVRHENPSSPLFIQVEGNSAPDRQGLMVFNPKNESGQDACMAARVGGRNGGNPYLSLDIYGEQGFSMGMDNADGNKLKIKSWWHFSGANDDYSRLTIQQDGNVGIGTSRPGAKLEVNGLLKTGSLEVQNSLTIGSGKEIFFADNGQIRSLDNNHRFIFDRSNNIMELREFGNIIFSPGATSGQQTGRMILLSNGHVGIGTNNPVRGKLEVTSWATYSFHTIGGIGTNGSGGYTNNFGSGTGNWGSSIYAEGKMVAHSFIVPSDVRTKEIAGKTDSRIDLETVKGIQVTDYQMKDRVAKGNCSFKKVIAQQVREVFPQAVSVSTDVVPDIYQIAHLENGWVKLDTDLNAGEKVQLIFGSEKIICEVLETKTGGFRVATGRQGEVFVYGREVDDFLSVDYEAIAMLNVSATQELAKQVETLQFFIKELSDRTVPLEPKPHYS